STECLIQLTKLGYDATPFNQILKQNAKREMRLRLGKVTVADVLAAQPVTTNLLKFMRASDRKSGSAGMPRPISYAVFCLKKKNRRQGLARCAVRERVEESQHSCHARPQRLH